MTYELEILNDGKHVGWLTGSDIYEMDTIAYLIEDAGYEMDWGDNK